MSLQCVISGNASCSVGFGLCGVADVGDAKIDVSAFKSLEIGLPIREVNRRVRKTGVLSDNRIPVGVVLLERRSFEFWIRRGDDLRLIEGQRNNRMSSKISDVTDVDCEIVARLPLDVERLVHGIGELVGAVVVSE